MSAPITRAYRSDAEEALWTPFVRRLAISAGALMVTLALGRLMLTRFDTPVSALEIRGANRHVQPDEVRMAALPALDAKLFALDLGSVREAIERLPWVASARVDRQWPGRLSIHVVEREPFARWGEDEALSTEGVVFAPGKQLLSPTLPALHGAPGREREVMTMYGQLADRLSETPFALQGLSQDARGEWTGTTRGGIALRFGRVNPIEQVPRLRGPVLAALSSRLPSVQRIDLRYANGFAVAWRDVSAGKAPSPLIPEPPVEAPRESVTPGAAQ
jgi:cell division protein FtsQ